MAASTGTRPQFRLVRRTNNIPGSFSFYGWDLTPPFTSTEGLELWVQTHESYTVDLSFGSSNPKADGFWRSPMQADMDEFFTKMSIALEAFRELNFKHWKENRLMLVAGTVGHNHHNQYLTCWVVGIRVA